MAAIKPCLWFNGQAEEAARFYASLFADATIGAISRYGAGGRFPAGTAVVVEFTLAGRPFQALNGGPEYAFTPAISLSIACPDGPEVDRIWTALTTNGGSPGRCGWLTDRFGVSWQVVPDGLGTLLSDPNPARASRAMKAMMSMTKLDLAAMRTAADAN
jgi:predicted 3-demethylubiquinone-9 3-methyltransferase (glyoxalase superfamily)